MPTPILRAWCLVCCSLLHERRFQLLDLSADLLFRVLGLGVQDSGLNFGFTILGKPRSLDIGVRSRPRPTELEIPALCFRVQHILNASPYSI